MVLFIVAVLGLGTGVWASARHSKRAAEAEQRLPASAAKKVLKDTRRALVIGHTIVRAQLCQAFLATARCASDRFLAGLTSTAHLNNSRARPRQTPSKSNAGPDQCAPAHART